MDRLQQMAIWQKDCDEWQARIAALKADIAANPMDPEVLRKKREEWEADLERARNETPPDVIFLHFGPPQFDSRVEELLDLSQKHIELQFCIDEYAARRASPDGPSLDEVTFAKEHGLDIPSQSE